MPTVIAPRYGDPAAAGLAPHQLPVTDLAVAYPFELSIDLAGDIAAGSLGSPSHAIATKRTEGGVRVSLARGGFLDRDFVLNVGGLTGRSLAVVARDGEGYVALASFLADVPSTTVEDLAKWNPTALDRALHAPGLSALMVERGRLSSGVPINYAMGLNVSTYRGLPLVRHGGSYGGYRAEFTVVPSANMTIALLCNVSSAAHFVLSQRIMDAYLTDQLAPAAPVPVPGGSVGSGLSGILRENEDLPGAYFSDELDVRWTIQPGPTHGIALQRRNLPPVELHFNAVFSREVLFADLL